MKLRAAATGISGYLLSVSLVLAAVTACGGGGTGSAAGTGGGKAGTGGVVGSGGISASGGTPGNGSGTGGAYGTGGSSNSSGTGGGGTASGGVNGGRDGGVPDVGGDAAPNLDAAPDQASASGTTFVYVSGNTATIRVYKLDLATGMLEASSMTTDGGSNPSYMAFNPNKKFAYAVNESGATSKILAFSIGADGALTKLAQNGEAATAPGQGPPHLSVHSGGKWIYAAHYTSGHTTVHAIMSNGGVGTPVSNDKTATSEAHQAKQDPTGKFLLVPCRTPNYIAQYRLDDTTGMLTANTPARVTPPVAGTGPRHMDFHPNGKWAYVLGELNGHVISYQYDGATGLLSSPEDLAILPSENAGAHILVHVPSGGQFVFVSLRQNNEIATLAVNPTTGRLTVTAHQTSMISGPRDFTIDPSGRYLLVANQTTGTVIVFEINVTDGTLTFRSSVTVSGITQPAFVGALVLP